MIWIVKIITIVLCLVGVYFVWKAINGDSDGEGLGLSVILLLAVVPGCVIFIFNHYDEKNANIEANIISMQESIDDLTEMYNSTDDENEKRDLQRQIVELMQEKSEYEIENRK